MARLYLCLLLVLCCIDSLAQRRLVVVDMDLLVPVAGANVVSRQGVQTTDSMGVVYVAKDSKTITISHVNYESLILHLNKEDGDTIYMLSKLLNLQEVLVLGKGKQPDYRELNKGFQLDKTEAQLVGASPSTAASFDLGKVLSALIPKKWRSSYKKAQRKKRLKEILDELIDGGDV